VRHTGAGGRVAFWAQGDTVVCQIEDEGHITDPLAGRIPVAPGREGGRGLLLANHLCDLVRVYTRPGATAIRLQMYCDDSL
jgi:anti-sigma regulatory factor (Ser/Thr protein kinase)